ncbi:MAG: hypothetical protein KDE33_16100 [Bacteroidetes bacterium]|nr:hypothetical protein [Bacteroidota bacterium]
MPLFHDLILSSTNANSLSSFLSQNIQSFYNLHNSSIERLNEEKNDICDFIESKRLVFEQLDFSTNTNKAFVSILFDFAERFGFLSIVNIENILNRNELYLGKRREAAKLFLLGIRNNNDYIERYDAICNLLQSSLETEEDTDKDIISTFLNYFAKVIHDTSTEFSAALKGELIISRNNAAFTFLQSEYLSRFLAIDISEAETAYNFIHNLIDEINDRNYAIEVVPVFEQEYLVEENTAYSNSLKNINVTFDTIREIAVRKCSGIETHLRGRGVTPLTEEDELYIYLLRYGNMHKAKIESCLNNFPFAEIDRPVEMIDWGCGQGLATVVFKEFIDRNNHNIEVSKVYLIDPSLLTLKRAALHLKYYPSLGTPSTICKSFDSLELQDFGNDENVIKIHFLSNVLDIDEAYYSQEHLIELIKNSQSGTNYFICCSPYITDYKTNKIDNFVHSFENRRMLLSVDERTGQWRGTNWSRVIRVFKCKID